VSKITNNGLTRSGTGCFIAVPVWQQWASKGYWTADTCEYSVVIITVDILTRRVFVSDTECFMTTICSESVLCILL